MRKKLCCLIIVHLLSSFAWCDVLFEQSFTDSDAYSKDEKATVLTGSLDAKFHREKGHRLGIKNHQKGVVYKLDDRIANPDSYKRLYLSFCFRVLADNARNKFSGLVLYQDGDEVFGMGNDYSSADYSFWGSDGEGIPIGEIPTEVDDNVHMIVMRIDFDENGAEKIKVGLDPFCRRSESRQPEDIWTSYETELSFDELRLRSGNVDFACEFDEVRIGTDWDSVTPSDDKPGEYIEAVTENMTVPADAELIGNNIARFFPEEKESLDTCPSFVLEHPREGKGSVPDSWRLVPRFRTFKDKKYAYLDIPAEADLYGTGEVTGGLLRNGYKITLFNKDAYAYHTADQLYQSHPWVLGVRKDGSAFGVIFDTTWKAELDLRSGILFTTPRQAQDFPVIVIEGKDPQEVMIRLGDLAGTMPMPPRWSLGYQQCRYSYYPDERVREIADKFRTKRIPCDVIWMDIDYMDGYRVFTFDPNRFPEPEATNGYLHSLGFKSVWMIDPGVKLDPGYFVYDSGTEKDVWVKDADGNNYVGPVWPGDCVFPDFTMPKTRSWWAGLYDDFIAKGIDGVWNDMDEPSIFNDETDGTMPLDNHHRGGSSLPSGPHLQYHNVYGMLMVKATQRGIKEARPDKRPFVLTRANFLGGHRYAATWTGDNNASWQHLKWSIPMSLNLGLSGQPFSGPDIGGFLGNASPELWANWISVGAFYPFSRAHTIKGSENQEPWSFGEKTKKAARVALQKRYRLMPYLYTVFRQAHKTGLPVMRPVFFANPENISLRMEDEAFLLGSDLLVIPQWAESPRLPEGVWRSVSLAGEDPEDTPYQCELRVRGGSIVPVGPVVQSTAQISLHNSPLTLIVVPDENGTAKGTLYEDTGDGYAYRERDFCFSEFTAVKEDSQVKVKCASQKGKKALSERFATVAVIGAEGIHYGFGDLVEGVKVDITSPPEDIPETTLPGY